MGLGIGGGKVGVRVGLLRERELLIYLLADICGFRSVY